MKQRREESAWIETNNLLCGCSGILNFTFSSLLIVFKRKVKKNMKEVHQDTKKDNLQGWIQAERGEEEMIREQRV